MEKLPEKIDFMKNVDIIFQRKQEYKKITEQEKKDNFFMVNRKFAIGGKNKIKINGKDCDIYRLAQFFNNKHVDKLSAMDLWVLYFKNQTSIPVWYWAKNTLKKEKESKITKADRELFINTEKISQKDFDFMVKHYPDDVEHEIKKLKRFEK